MESHLQFLHPDLPSNSQCQFKLDFPEQSFWPVGAGPAVIHSTGPVSLMPSWYLESLLLVNIN